MKFRKILSAVTALAMSASAVAGLAVTANAATEYDYYISESEAAQTYSDSTDYSGWKLDNGSVSLMDISEKGYGVSAGYGLAIQTSGKQTPTNATYSIDTVTNGTVAFSTSFSPYDNYAHDGAVFTFTDSNGDSVLTVTYSGASSAKSVSYQTNAMSSAATSSATTNLRNGSTIKQTISATFDLENSQVTLVCTADSTTLISGTYDIEDGSFISGVTITVSNIRTGSNQYNGLVLDDTLFYAYTDKSITPVAYTINYKTDENTTVAIKSATGRSDKTVYAVDDLSDRIAGAEDGYEDNKYFLTDDYDTIPSLDLSQSTSLDVYVRIAKSINVYADASYDSSVVFANTTATEGDTVTFSYPKYAQVGKTLYEVPSKKYDYVNTDNPYWYTYVKDNVTEDIEVTIEYTEEEGTSVYAFVEAEDVLGIPESGVETSFATARGSSGHFGKIGVSTADEAVTLIKDLPAGTYTAEMYISAENRDTVVYIRVGNTDVLKQTATGTNKSDVFAITEPTDVRVYSTRSDNKVAIDYILIREVTPEIIATANTVGDLSDMGATTLVEVSDESEVGAVPETTDKVTTYTIKVATSGYSGGVPKLIFANGAAVESLTPSGITTDGDDVVYGYQGTDGYYYFIIQTLNISDVAATVQFGSTTADVG